MPNAVNLLVLQTAVDLPQLTPGERALLRDITIKYAMGAHYNWDPRQKDLVVQLFKKVSSLLGMTFTYEEAA